MRAACSTECSRPGTRSTGRTSCLGAPARRCQSAGLCSGCIVAEGHQVQCLCYLDLLGCSLLLHVHLSSGSSNEMNTQPIGQGTNQRCAVYVDSESKLRVFFFNVGAGEHNHDASCMEVAGAEAPQLNAPLLLFFCSASSDTCQFSVVNCKLICTDEVLKLAGEVPWYTCLLPFRKWKPFPGTV